MTQTTDERIIEFCDRMAAMYAKHYQANYDILTPPTFYPQAGRKNVRIVERDGDTGKDKSVYCFINKTTGDIYKAAGWKAPAKDARGSIWNDDCDVGQGKPADMFGSGLYK